MRAKRLMPPLLAAAIAALCCGAGGLAPAYGMPSAAASSQLPTASFTAASSQLPAAASGQLPAASFTAADPAAGGGNSSDAAAVDDSSRATINITGYPETLEAGKSASISYVVTNTDSDIAWSSSDETVATVSSAGTVKGIAPGTARITATVDGVSRSVDIEVAAPAIESISVVVQGYDQFEMAKDAHEIHVGEILKLKAAVTPKGAPTGGVSWSVSDTNIATIDSDGQLIARAKGDVTATAAAGGKSGRITFSVLPNGPLVSSYLIYGIAGLLLVIALIIVIAAITARSRKAARREEEERARLAAKKKRDAEAAARERAARARDAEMESAQKLMDEGYKRGYIDKEREMTEKMTRIYDTAMTERFGGDTLQPGAEGGGRTESGKGQDGAKPSASGESRPFALEDIGQDEEAEEGKPFSIEDIE